MKSLAEHGIDVRILGGVAVAIRCRSAANGSPLARTHADLDLATAHRHVPTLTKVLTELGYTPQARFNALHGQRRLMFAMNSGHMDIFVDRFEMCHALDLRSRLDVHPETLPLVDLLLTKLQIAQVNRKDVVDVAAILADHPLTATEEGVNLGYLTAVTARDWGWWRTVTTNLILLKDIVPELQVDAQTQDKIQAAIATVLDQVHRQKKTARWRARSVIGERVPWRDDPEEI